MKRVKKLLLVSISIIGVAFFLLALRPVPKASKDNCEVVTGKIDTIWKAGEKDINFKLVDDGRIYYINRAEERGLSLQDLNDELEGKIVLVKYIKHWTPLDPLSRYMHVASLKAQGRIIYTKIDHIQTN